MVRGITFAGPGKKELPSVVTPSQLSKLGVKVIELTEGSNASESISDRLIFVAVGINIHDIKQASVTSLEVNNEPLYRTVEVVRGRTRTNNIDTRDQGLSYSHVKIYEELERNVC